MGERGRVYRGETRPSVFGRAWVQPPHGDRPDPVRLRRADPLRDHLPDARLDDVPRAERAVPLQRLVDVVAGEPVTERPLALVLVLG